MIENFKDENGLILGYIEWQLVDQNGKHDNHGAFVWINDLYIAPQFRGNGNLRRLSLMIKEKVPWAKEFYFKREKYNKRQRQYKIEDF